MFVNTMQREEYISGDLKGATAIGHQSERGYKSISKQYEICYSEKYYLHEKQRLSFLLCHMSCVLVVVCLRLFLGAKSFLILAYRGCLLFYHDSNF